MKNRRAVDRLGGYFALARRVFFNPVANESLAHFKLWVWIISRARYLDGKRLRRGQLYVCYDELREVVRERTTRGLRLPARSTVQKMLAAFVDADMISVVQERRGMIITVMKYDAYQAGFPEVIDGGGGGSNFPIIGTQNSSIIGTQNSSIIGTQNSNESDNKISELDGEGCRLSVRRNDRLSVRRNDRLSVTTSNKKERKKESPLRYATGAKESQRSRPKVSFPAKFELTDGLLDYASGYGFDERAAAFEFEKFKNWHLSRGSRFSDWARAFRNWILKAVEIAADKKQRGGRNRSSVGLGSALYLRAVREREERLSKIRIEGGSDGGDTEAPAEQSADESRSGRVEPNEFGFD